MRLIKRLGFCLAAAIPAVTLAACSSGGSATPAGPPPEVSSVTVNAIPTADAAGIYIAEDNGYFTQQGLNVKIVANLSGNDAIGDLQNGTAQFVQGTDIAFIQAQAARSFNSKPVNLRIVSDTSQLEPGNSGLYVMPGRYGTLQQLVKAHATVGVPAANPIGNVLIGSLLTGNGDSPSALKYEVLSPEVLPIALAKGAVAAAYLPEPLGTYSEQAVGAEELADLDQGPTQDFPVGMIATSASWAQSHPNTVAAFQRALNEGQLVADTNRGAVQDGLEKWTPNQSPLIAASIAVDSYPLSMSVAQMQRVPDAMYKFGLLSKPFQISSMIEPAQG